MIDDFLADYLADLNARLRVPKADRDRILVEVRDHLEDAAANALAENVSRELAIDRAVRDFGSVALIATEFNAIAGTRAMRRATVVAVTAGIAVVVGFLFAVTTQPHSGVTGTASIGAQVSFFAVALAFQVAAVAGVRAVSRVLALGRVPVAQAEDRRLVRRCVVTCVGALGVAAVGWAACIGLAANSFAHPDRFTLAVGAVSMIGGVMVAAVAITKLDVNPSDEAAHAPARVRGVFDLGERAVDLVRRHPISACSAIAGIAALIAMSHSETTVAAATPWGVLQAVAVVLGFVLLGPSLGLRESRTA